MKKNQKINLAEIQKRKHIFESATKKSIEDKKKGRQSPARILLNEIRDMLKLSVEKGLAITTIAKNIEKTFNFKISPATVRKFIVDEMKLKLTKSTSKKPAEQSKVTSDFLNKLD